jgi:hypothetical protein
MGVDKSVMGVAIFGMGVATSDMGVELGIGISGCRHLG